MEDLLKEEQELWEKMRETSEVREEDYKYLKRIEEIKVLLWEIVIWKQ